MLNKLSLFQQFKNKWLAAQEAKLQAEFAPKLALMQATQHASLDALQQHTEALTRQQTELQRLMAVVTDQETILQDRKVQVAKANEELRTQLRLVEAKAAPDRVWVEAFSRGYQTAWDTMWPIMAQGVQNMQVSIEQKSEDAILARLDSVVVERATRLGHTQARAVQELLKKRDEFTQKQTISKTPEEKMRYENYLTALDWILHANGLHQDQPTTE